jgi:hypothetical protein
MLKGGRVVLWLDTMAAHSTAAVTSRPRVSLHVQTVTTVEEIEDSAEEAWCVVLPGHNERSTEPSPLSIVRGKLPHLPRIVVTDRRANATRQFELEALVDPRHIEEALPREVRRLRALTIRAVVRDVVTVDRHLPPVVRRAIVLATRSTTPVRTVADLAMYAGCSRSTLWKAWRSDPHQRMRIEDLLDWLLLVDALGQKTHAVSWVDIATRLSVHEHTLRNVCRRLTGLSLIDAERNVDSLFSNGSVRDMLTKLVGHQVLGSLADEL